MMPAGRTFGALPPSPLSAPTGLRPMPDMLIVPLFVTTIALPAEVPIVFAEFTANRLTPPELIVSFTPVDKVIVPVLEAPHADAITPYKVLFVRIWPGPPRTVMFPVPAVRACISAMGHPTVAQFNV